MRVFYFENDDASVRANSSAGGLFTVLAELTINNGGVVYGASFDKNWSVVHSRVERIDDISKLRGSKYVFTDIRPCLDPIEDDLKDSRRVLFCGTPCQVATVRKRFGENEDLLLVEVVCHGAPQPKYWDLYLNELLQKQGKSRNDISSINFRDKTEGWKNYSVRIDFKDGSCFTQSHRVNPYILAFIYNYTLRTGCSKCSFKCPNSKADISMGDFWGIETLAPDLDNNLGTTIAISDTAKGEAILNRIAYATTLSIDQLTQYNPAIEKAPDVPFDVCKFEQQTCIKGIHYAANNAMTPILNKNISSLKSRIKHLLYGVFRKVKGCQK